MTSLKRRFAAAAVAGAAVLWAGAANATIVSPNVLAPVQAVAEKGAQTTPVHYRGRAHHHRRRAHRRGPRVRFFYRPYFYRRARLRRRCFNRFRPVFHTYRCHRIRRAHYRRYY